MKTSTGFEYELAEDAMDNMELLDLLGELADENFTHVRQIITILIGEDGRKKLYAHCHDGRKTSVSKVLDELREILNGEDKVKNSSSSLKQSETESPT